MKEFIKSYFNTLKWVLIISLVMCLFLIPFFYVAITDNRIIGVIIMILIIPLIDAIVGKMMECI